MKKLFTMLGSIFLMGSAVVQAQSGSTPLTLYIYDSNYEQISSQETKLVYNEDGSLSIEDFLNAGYPVSFKFDIPEAGNSSSIDFTGNIKEDSYSVDFLDSDGEDMECWFQPEDGDKTSLWYPFAYTGVDYSYIYRCTETEILTYGAEYYGEIYLGATNSQSKWVFYYIDFYFDMPEAEEPGENPDEGPGEGPGVVPGGNDANKVTIYIDDYDESAIADPFESGLVVNKDGTVTITDFMYSGQPVSFRMDAENVGEWGTLKITSPTQDYYGSTYLRNRTDTDYLYCTAYGFNDVEGPTAFEMPYVFEDYSAVYRYDITDPEIEYEYYASICMNAWMEDDSNVGYFYIDFYFNLTEQEEPGENPGEDPGEEPGGNGSTDVTVYVCDYDGNEIAKSFDTELMLDEDGIFTLTDFFNSGSPVSFTFDTPERGDYADITFTGDIDLDDGVAYFYDADGNDMTCYVYPLDGSSAIELGWTGAWVDGYSYIARFTEEEQAEYGFEFYGVICASGYDNGWKYYYLDFYFNMPTADDPGVNPGEGPGVGPGVEPDRNDGNKVIVYIDDYDGYEIADSFESGLVVNKDGTVTITDFMYSGQPVSFRVDAENVGEWGSLQITSPTQDYYGSTYLRNSTDTDYLYCTVYGFNDVEGPTAFEMPYVFEDYSSVYRYDITNPENEYEYFASICMNAWKEDDSNTGYFYIDLYFNLSENGTPGTSGIGSIENADAPVEFYNLNGVKVDNPSNGIFIRRQGNNVSKVIVK